MTKISHKVDIHHKLVWRYIQAKRRKDFKSAMVWLYFQSRWKERYMFPTGDMSSYYRGRCSMLQDVFNNIFNGEEE